MILNAFGIALCEYVVEMAPANSATRGCWEVPNLLNTKIRCGFLRTRLGPLTESSRFFL
jgi:hypothetical protein